MLKRYPNSLLAGTVFFLAAMALTAQAGPEAATIEDPTAPGAFGSVVVQNEGRLKPLDSLARIYLLSCYGKSKIDGLTAADWLWELMVHPAQAYQRRSFKVRNNDVMTALGIEPDKSMRYSFATLGKALESRSHMLRQLHGRPSGERSLVENQMVDLHIKAINYEELSRSLTCLHPDLEIEDASLAADLGVEPNTPVSYLEISRKNEVLLARIETLTRTARGQTTKEDDALLALVAAINKKIKDRASAALRIVPPQGASAADEEWLAPWALLDGRPLTAFQGARLQDLQTIFQNDLGGDSAAVEEGLRAYQEACAHRERIALEVTYNRLALFYKSLYAYILSFLLLTTSWLFRSKKLQRASWLVLWAGALTHTAGIIMRIVIMNRPPVSTLYESIIFVGLISVWMSLFLESKRRNGLGIFLATVAGSILHFVGFRYAADGDTMGMLVAVLNSNFWLATHVVTITIGYGCSLVAGLAGHAYLVTRIFAPGASARHAEIARNAVGLALVALFFTTFGTILGGIWADQSWGRFWGWDPKENGALLIVLWLLLLLHGRISGHLKDLGFAAGLALTNVTVALAWFGVNLLNVGLHSYGFTENIANNLAIFCGAEVLLVFAAMLGIRMRRVPAV